MRYYIDTEFLENGPNLPIYLLSIAMVAEDGREFYLVNGDCPINLANEWVKENVLPHIDRHAAVPLNTIRERVLDFVAGDEHPEFWAWHADYDWVVFCQIFGTMAELPKSFPMFCRDLKQLVAENGNPQLPKQPEDEEHDALNDARWVRDMHQMLIEQLDPPKDKAIEENSAPTYKPLTEEEIKRLDLRFGRKSRKEDTPDQIQRKDALDAAAREMAVKILGLTPLSREQSLALTNLEGAIFWAKSAIDINE